MDTSDEVWSQRIWTSLAWFYYQLQARHEDNVRHAYRAKCWIFKQQRYFPRSFSQDQIFGLSAYYETTSVILSVSPRCLRKSFRVLVDASIWRCLCRLLLIVNHHNNIHGYLSNPTRQWLGLMMKIIHQSCGLTNGILVYADLSTSLGREHVLVHLWMSSHKVFTVIHDALFGIKFYSISSFRVFLACYRGVTITQIGSSIE